MADITELAYVRKLWGESDFRFCDVAGKSTEGSSDVQVEKRIKNLRALEIMLQGNPQDIFVDTVDEFRDSNVKVEVFWPNSRGVPTDVEVLKPYTIQEKEKKEVHGEEVDSTIEQIAILSAKKGKDPLVIHFERDNKWYDTKRVDKWHEKRELEHEYINKNFFLRDHLINAIVLKKAQKLDYKNFKGMSLRQIGDVLIERKQIKEQAAKEVRNGKRLGKIIYHI